MSQVSLVPTNSVDQFWPHLREGFQRSVMKTGGDLTTGDLWVACRSGSAFLLIAHEGDEIRGASIWRPDTWQTGKVIRCLALYGRGLSEWQEDMTNLAMRIGIDCGATRIIAEGRAGWKKTKGVKVLRYLYEMPIPVAMPTSGEDG